MYIRTSEKRGWLLRNLISVSCRYTYSYKNKNKMPQWHGRDTDIPVMINWYIVYVINFFSLYFISSGVTCVLARCSEIGSGFRRRTCHFVGHLTIFGHQCHRLCIVDRFIGHNFIPSVQDRSANHSKDIRWPSVQVSNTSSAQTMRTMPINNYNPFLNYNLFFPQRLLGRWIDFARGKGYASGQRQRCTCECIFGRIETIVFGWRLCRFG